MGDYEEGRRIGHTGAWDPKADYAGQVEGWRQREEEEAAWKARSSWSGGASGMTGAGAGYGVLLVLVMGGVALFALRVYLVSLVCSMAILALALWVGGRSLRADWRPLATLRTSAAAHLLAILAAIWALVGAHFLSRIGLDLTPGLDVFPPSGGSPRLQGAWSVAFPVIIGLLAGAWWLHRSAPPTAFARPLRWAGLLTLLAVAPLLGVRLALAVLDLF